MLPQSGSQTVYKCVCVLLLYVCIINIMAGFASRSLQIAVPSVVNQLIRLSSCVVTFKSKDESIFTEFPCFFLRSRPSFDVTSKTSLKCKILE